MKKASVTVTFSVVFLLLFSFILSFFEMAAYTARSAYHAAASKLAVENAFAAFEEPLFSEYQILGFELPKYEDEIEWVGSRIGEDVQLMTVKGEDQRSLLVRGGAEFELTELYSLTQNKGEGFYREATRAMRYRSVSEAVDWLKEYLGIQEKLEKQMLIIADQAKVADSYVLVEKDILKLMELVDGVKISQYEYFLRGKATTFQNDYYVKYFCNEPKTAIRYFDRVELYNAFEKNYRNPVGNLALLKSKVSSLERKVRIREAEMADATEEFFKVCGDIQQRKEEIAATEKQILELTKEKKEVDSRKKKLQKKTEKTQEEAEELQELIGRSSTLFQLLAKEQDKLGACEAEVCTLEDRKEQLEERIALLEDQKKEHHVEYVAICEDEELFIEECKKVSTCCDKAYQQVEKIEQELHLAISAKARCQSFLKQMEPILGTETTHDYEKNLEKYSLYEGADGYDFEKMKDTLSMNSFVARKTGKTLQGEDSAALLQAYDKLSEEQKYFGYYSFEGLRLNYGEINLAGSVETQVKEVFQNAAANSFLELLTTNELSERELDTSHLPSRFQFAGEENGGFWSMVGSDLGDVFDRLAASFQGGVDAGSAIEAVTDPVLFQAYLATHFSSYSDAREDTVLGYELEYIVEGYKGDRENLAGFATRVTMLRMVEHLISLYSDTTRRSQAEAAAFAACGAIGLPALTNVVLFAFLLIWACEEAIIDVAALLAGKSLLLYPGKTGGSLQFSELISFGGSMVRRKAAQKKDPIGVSLDYNAFLQLFVFLTPKEVKCYRAMDLIQENLREWYKQDFRLKRICWKADYLVDQREYSYSYVD